MGERRAGIGGRDGAGSFPGGGESQAAGPVHGCALSVDLRFSAGEGESERHGGSRRTGIPSRFGSFPPSPRIWKR